MAISSRSTAAGNTSTSAITTPTMGPSHQRKYLPVNTWLHPPHFLHALSILDMTRTKLGPRNMRPIHFCPCHISRGWWRVAKEPLSISLFVLRLDRTPLQSTDCFQSCKHVLCAGRESGLLLLLHVS
ncbi:hypothetical protein BDW66DRAFT_126841 [Aspergillus desertorum]